MRECVQCSVERVVMLGIAGRVAPYFMCGGCYAASRNSALASVEPRKLKRPVGAGHSMETQKTI